jgi:DNA-binding SARP family transcriptional activator
MTARIKAVARMGTLVVAAWLAGSGCGGSGGGGGSGTRPELGSGVDVPGLVALADSAVARGDAETARRALDRAIAKSPDDPSVRLARGRFYTAIRRYSDAKTEFDRAAALDPASPEPHYQLGLAYLAAGERDRARASLERAVALDPGHAGAREALSPLLAARYEAAGIPGDYPRLVERPTLSRGELAVALSVELGADPDRNVWRSDEAARMDWPELEAAWGSRWVRAAIARKWIAPYADGALHLEDPVTRGSLALVLSRIVERTPASAADSAGGSGGAGVPPRSTATFPDLGSRHYLGPAAERAVRLGLPTREGGRFEPLAVVTGLEMFRAVRGLARALGASPVVSSEP